MINAVSNSRGAAPHRDDGRVLRRRQLRHVRARLRAAVPVHLAEREVGGDGAGAAGRRAVDRRAAGRRGARPGRTTRRRDAQMRAVRRGADRGASRWRRSCPGWLYDDGIIDPRDTRTVLGIALSADPHRAGRTAPTATGCSGCDRPRPMSRRCSSPTAARSPAGCSAPAATSASARSPCSPTPTPTRRTCARPTPPSGCRAARPADTYLRGDADHRRRSARRRRRHPSRLRVPVRERRLRPRRHRRRAHLDRAAARGDRRDGQQDRVQAADGRGRRAGARPSCDPRRGHRGRPAGADQGHPRAAVGAACGSCSELRPAGRRGRQPRGPRRRARSATRRCSASPTSRPAGTSRCRSWPTGTARSGPWANASARSSAGTRRSSRRRPSPLVERVDGHARASCSAPRARPRPGDRLHRRRHGRVPRRRGRAVLLPRDEHPAAGRAPGHRVHDRPRPGRAAARRRRRRRARPRAAAAARPRDRGAALRRGPRRRLAAAERHRCTAFAVPGVAARVRPRPGRAGIRLDAASSTAARSASTTTRCWPR